MRRIPPATLLFALVSVAVAAKIAAPDPRLRPEEKHNRNSYLDGERWTIVFDVTPARGRHLVLGYPGLIHNGGNRYYSTLNALKWTSIRP